MSNDPSQRAYRLVLDLEHPLAETRREAAGELLDLGAEATLPLVEGFETASPAGKQRILMIFARLDAPKAIPTLMGYVLDTPHESVDNHRALAMRGIVRSVKPKHGRHCFDFFVRHRRDPDDFVRALALEGLGALGDNRARAFLEEAAGGDAEDTVRESAQRALLTLDVNAAVAPQGSGREETSLHSEKELRFMLASREAAQRKLGIQELIRRDLNPFEAFTDAIKGGHALARRSGIQGLGVLGEPRAFPLLRNIAFNDYSDRDDRALALRALARVPLPADSDRPGLIRDARRFLKDDSDPFIVAAALKFYATLDPRDGLDTFLRYLGGREAWLKEVAAEGLVEVARPGDQRVITAVGRALEASGKRTRDEYQKETDWSEEGFKLQGLLLSVLRTIIEPVGANPHEVLAGARTLEILPSVLKYATHPRRELRHDALEVVRIVTSPPALVGGQQLLDLLDVLRADEDDTREELIDALECATLELDRTATWRLLDLIPRERLGELQRRLVRLVASAKTFDAQTGLKDIARRQPDSPAGEAAREELDRW